ncbi:MAG: HAD-IA family hydrolase [Rhodospirillales bacterium]|nr:HAD-IA family hydrolase [Rhodospirillales bacterium]
MSKSSNIRLVVFDCDGTLVDSQHNICAAMGAAFRDTGREAPTDDAIRRIVGLSLDEAVTALSPGITESENHVIRMSYKENFMLFRKSPEYSEPLYPGIAEILRELDGQGFLLGVATGKTQRGLAATLEHHNLKSTFVTLQTADDAPGKPHPGMLEQAMAAVGADRSDTVLIGDTVFDMAMAKNAGTSGIGVSWGYHETGELVDAGAHEIVEECGQLFPAVHRLIGA